MPSTNNAKSYARRAGSDASSAESYSYGNQGQGIRSLASAVKNLERAVEELARVVHESTGR